MKLPRVELPEVTLPKVGPLPRRSILAKKELLPEQQLEGTEWPPFNPRGFKFIFKVRHEKSK
jgi:hypothetical protein